MRPLRVAVAASGGRDSTALLHCTARAAAALGIEVVALHVHHGLMPAADDWLAQVRAQSRRWGAGFASHRLGTQPSPGESVEAWARNARYQALAQMAVDAGCGLVLLGQHRRDQAETWLLQALRGGGPAGLSAMPREAQRHGLVWSRPWLDSPREAIDAYVRRFGLKHADDASNSGLRFARSRLRAHVWPGLIKAFPDAELALAQSAARAQEAAAVLAEVAAVDLPSLLMGQERALDREAWLRLSPARRKLALRAWLAQVLAQAVPESLIARLSQELPVALRARWPAGGQELRLYRGVLRAEALPAGQVVQVAAAPVAAIPLGLTGASCQRLPAWAGRLLVEPVAARGLSMAQLTGLHARERQGGEQFQLAPRSALRSLKKQYQARAVPQWQRSGPLLVNARDELVFVPGLGIDARWWAGSGEPQFGLQWLADATGPAAGDR